MLILGQFSLLFCIVYCIENRLKINIPLMGKFFIILLTEINFKTLRVTFFKVFLSLRNYGMDLKSSGFVEITET